MGLKGLDDVMGELMGDFVCRLEKESLRLENGRKPRAKQGILESRS